ncbi:hypothetical protein QN277_001771 [Acacia crassicarpa]|uniref:Peptidase metallopeptidase domain-containing protein n=1 Tax=Acacia crassicarpa TaxID=499986 RepID=A0AAE1TIR7_9FABA|nr:hypothetical protein QN277_001771 [Acacia crassicarpa]
MRVMTRTYTILVFISYLFFGDVFARSIPPLFPASWATFSETQKFKAALDKIPKGDWISRIKPSTASLQTEESSKIKRYLEYLGILKERLNNVNDALEEFQKTYNLPVTGKLDNDTIKLIKRPRCGVTDVINVTSTMPTSFNWSWPEGKKQFNYTFIPKNNVDKSLKLKDAFSSAFSRWAKVTGLSFTETSSFNQSDILIVFLGWDENEVVAGSDLLGSVRKSGRRAMYFNVKENWVVPTADNGTVMADDELDIETVAMHQIGHMVGFRHTTTEEAAVMFPFMERGQRKLEFATDESESIQQAFRSVYNTTSNGGAAGGVGPGWVGLGIALLLSFCF